MREKRIKLFKCICCQRKYYSLYQNKKFQKFNNKKLCFQCNFINVNNNKKGYKKINIKDVKNG